MLVLNNGRSVGRQAALFQTGKQVVQVHAADTETELIRDLPRVFASFLLTIKGQSIKLFLINELLDDGRARIPGTSGKCSAVFQPARHTKLFWDDDTA